MRVYFKSGAYGAAMALLATLPAWGQDFTYTNDFNSYPQGAKPPGWVTQWHGLMGAVVLEQAGSTVPYDFASSIAPAIMTEDPSNWYLQSEGGVIESRGWGEPTHQVYSTDAFSGGHRFNLVHPGQWVSSYDNSDTGVGTSATAWYVGNNDANYPLNLQNRSMKAEFDLLVRHARRWWWVGSTVSFAVQPVVDRADAQRAAQNWWLGSGWQAGGFSVEVDTLKQDWDPCPSAPIAQPGLCGVYAASAHIGLNVHSAFGPDRSLNSVQASPDLIGCETAYTRIEQGLDTAGYLPPLCYAGDFGLPMHMTVYYNRTISGMLNDGVTPYSDGGPGKVVVYLKMPAGANPWAPADAFGSAPTDSPDGRKVIDFDLGPWPAPGAIFGFAAGTAWEDMVAQFDNLTVTTGEPDPGTPGPGPTVAALDPGPETTLGAGAAVANSATPGWDVVTYLVGATDMSTLKSSIAFNRANGWYLAHQTEPDIEFSDSGYSGNASWTRPVPGFAGRGNDHIGMLAKGWIVFPEGEGITYPRHYSIGVNADDRFELYIGGNLVLAGSPGMGSGPTAGTYCDLVVPAAGAYPIQLLWLETTGDAGVEVYRRIIATDLATTYRYQPLGCTDHAIPDQPRVYVTVNGSPVPDPALADPADTFSVVNLAPSQKIAGTASGSPGFKLKTVQGPNRYYQGDHLPDLYYASDTMLETWNTVPMRFLDFLGDVGGGTVTTDTLNFRGESPDGARGFDGLIPGTTFPGLPAYVGQFALRADGFTTLAAGDYYLAMSGGTQAALRFGNQTALTTYAANGNALFRLHVDQAGTYPIRVECFDQSPNAFLELAQLIPGVPAAVLVNSEASTIKVFQSATSGEYAWRTQGVTIPTSAKRTGAGADPGWNVLLRQTHPAWVWFSFACAVLENDLGGGPWPGPDFLSESRTADYIAYSDGAGRGRFPSLQTNFSTFAPAYPANGNAFAVAATGYIVFPAAGDYGFNTTTSGMTRMWIGDRMVQSFTWGYVDPFHWDYFQDNVPVAVHVDEPGIYDIRVEYSPNADPAHVPSPHPLFEVFQYLPDGTGVPLNTGAALQVYRTLTPAADPINPLRVPLSAKVAELDMGRDPGLHAEVVAFAPPAGIDPNGGLGHDPFWTLNNADDLLAAVISPGSPDAQLRQQGTSLYSGLVGDVYFGHTWIGDATAIPPGPEFPGSATNWFAARFTGYISLQRGGAFLGCYADDGVRITIGGKEVQLDGSYTVYWEKWAEFYVYVPADGLYPIQIDYMNMYAERYLWLTSMTLDGRWITLNSGTTAWGAKLYATALQCGYPFVDVDHDGDVDQADFGVFQACYSGAPEAPLTGLCTCFDRNESHSLDGADLVDFVNCFTGPSVPFALSPPPNCIP